MKALLSTSYWPNLQYFYYVLNAHEVIIEQHEHYQKQSFRNRSQILTSNGVIDLSIPVSKIHHKEIISSVEICYKENWQINHWRTITSAYKNSPYFDFFEDEIKSFYNSKPKYLFEYNLQQLNIILKILRANKKINFSSDFEKQVPDVVDLRNSIHPKIDFNQDLKTKPILNIAYYQTFANNLSFTPNLSILDLLFNKGLDTIDYLK